MELLENYRLVDLTVPIKTPNSEEMDPKLATSLAAEIEYLDHEDTIPLVRDISAVVRRICTGAVAGPQSVSGPPPMRGHVDAPWHYAPASGGKPSRRIDECPRVVFRPRRGAQYDPQKRAARPSPPRT